MPAWPTRLSDGNLPPTRSSPSLPESHPNVRLWPVRPSVPCLPSKSPFHSSAGHPQRSRDSFCPPHWLLGSSPLHVLFPLSGMPSLTSSCRSQIQVAPSEGGCPGLHPLNLLPPLPSPFYCIQSSYAHLKFLFFIGGFFINSFLSGEGSPPPESLLCPGTWHLAQSPAHSRCSENICSKEECMNAH